MQIMDFLSTHIERARARAVYSSVCSLGVKLKTTASWGCLKIFWIVPRSRDTYTGQITAHELGPRSNHYSLSEGQFINYINERTSINQI